MVQSILFLIANISFSFSVDHSLSGIIISTLFLIFPNSMSIIICTSIPVLDLTPWHVQNLLLPLNSHRCLLRTIVPFDLPCMKSGVSPSYLKYMIFWLKHLSFQPSVWCIPQNRCGRNWVWGFVFSFSSFFPSFICSLFNRTFIDFLLQARHCAVPSFTSINKISLLFCRSQSRGQERHRNRLKTPKCAKLSPFFHFLFSFQPILFGVLFLHRYRCYSFCLLLSASPR